MISSALLFVAASLPVLLISEKRSARSFAEQISPEKTRDSAYSLTISEKVLSNIPSAFRYIVRSKLPESSKSSGSVTSERSNLPSGSAGSGGTRSENFREKSKFIPENVSGEDSFIIWWKIPERM